jgi:hypothetical protein
MEIYFRGSICSMTLENWYNAYSFALVAYGQHLHPIVVEDDRKFMEISLSLMTLKAGGHQNKHWNLLNRNSDESD